MAAHRGKIFGIGLNKTGTRSLAVALRTFGFRTLHKGDAVTSELVDRAAIEGIPLLEHIGARYDAYLDVDAIVRRFVELDRQYPGSKFILTTADLDAWLSSRERHVRANQERALRGGYAGEFVHVDIDGWRAERERHHAAVLDYFADRDEDLLVFNVRAGDGWEELAPFLGCRTPRQAFPRENVGGVGTYNPERQLDRIRRRVDGWIGRVRAGRGLR